jgi:DNA invertase Pin-like site-specific DNA recombinase
VNAAIYARKSTEQHGADADAKSVPRQVEDARTFARAKGWTVSDDHVYTDDAISGAETRKLVNRQRLLDTIAAGRPPFQVLLLRDASRFSRRDGDEAFGELKRLAQTGVEIWFVQDGTRFTFGTFGDNVVGFVRAEMNAEFRRQIGKWTREAMVRKAQAGHVTGGRVFGYDNVRVDGHVERRINAAQADVVRRIFALSADGTGYARITKLLNADRAPAPTPKRGQPAGWSPSSVREVLHRPLYRGQVVWNQTRKRDAQGRTAPAARPETEWLRLDQPDLRIVSDDAWQAAHTRLRKVRTQLKIADGMRPAVRRDIDSKYLLSGFARCGTCGGSLSVLSRSRGRRNTRGYFYGCLAHAKRGATVCDNALVLPIDRVDAAVLSKFLRDALRPVVVTAILDGVFEALRPAAVTTNVADLRMTLRAVDTKIAHLTSAIEDGAALAPLVSKLKARQGERDDLLSAIGAAEAVGQIVINQATVRRKALAKIGEWRTLLATNPRQVLREALSEPLRFTPDGKQYQFDGGTRTGEYIAGLIGDSTLGGVPNGIYAIYREGQRRAYRGLATMRAGNNPARVPTYFSLSIPSAYRARSAASFAALFLSQERSPLSPRAEDALVRTSMPNGMGASPSPSGVCTSSGARGTLWSACTEAAFPARALSRRSCTTTPAVSVPTRTVAMTVGEST